MRNNFYYRIVLIVCALAGCFAGYRVDAALAETRDGESGNPAILAEADGVLPEAALFALPLERMLDREKKVTQEIPLTLPQGTTTQLPTELTPTVVPTLTPAPEPALTPGLSADLTPGAVTQLTPDLMPGTTPVLTPTLVPSATPTLTPGLTQKVTPAVEPSIPPEPTPATTAITYPSKIFGQVPDVNREDDYVTYFEFFLDLMEVAEPEIERKNLNQTALFAKFAWKAMWSGVDVNKLQINSKISRREAALAVYLAAEVLGESGTETSDKSAQGYVTDIKNLSAGEKKAVAYLYERGILGGYQVSGQKFYPNYALSEKNIATWMKGVSAVWEQ